MEGDVYQSGENSLLATYCARFKNFLFSYMVPLLVAAIFVGTALLISLIFHGYGYRRTFHNSPKLSCRLPNTIKPQVSKNEFMKVSNIRDYPFIGALLSNKPYIFLCTCVILNNRYLLSGANCFTANFPSLSVRLGSEFWDRYGRIYKVNSFIIDQNFNADTMENNIALVYVDTAIRMTKNVKPVEIVKHFNHLRKGVVVGWNNRAATERQSRLVQQEVIIWIPQQCSKYIGNKTNSTFVCASLSNTSFCGLDITGPLISKGKLIGFWSWGLFCPKSPSIFNNIYHLSTWFENISSSYFF